MGRFRACGCTSGWNYASVGVNTPSVLRGAAIHDVRPSKASMSDQKSESHLRHICKHHRVRSFKRSRDPQFAEKMTDIVGLYLDPPAHTVVLSIDEKSQIQALDRKQPGLPLKPRKPQVAINRYLAE